MEMNNNGEQIVLFGGGEDGLVLGTIFESIGIIFQFADSHKSGQFMLNRRILDLEELKTRDTYIIIASRKYEAEIYALLIFNGFQPEKVFSGNLLYSVHFARVSLEKALKYREVYLQNKRVNVGSCHTSDVTTAYDDTQLVRQMGFLSARSSLLNYGGGYNAELLASLVYVIKKKAGKLTILDFGGAFGIQYFKYKNFFTSIFGDKLQLKWCIIDLPPFVELGMNSIPEIKFYESMDDFLNECDRTDCLLLSGVLQTLFLDYEKYIDLFFDIGFDYIIIDGTNFIDVDVNTYSFLYMPIDARRQYLQISPMVNCSKKRFMNRVEENGYKVVFSYGKTANSFLYVNGEPEYQNGDSGYLLQKARI